MSTLENGTVGSDERNTAINHLPIDGTGKNGMDDLRSLVAFVAADEEKKNPAIATDRKALALKVLQRVEELGHQIEEALKGRLAI